MEKELKKDIELLVASIFSEKEQEDQKSQTQAALNESAETIERLTKTLEDTKEELTSVEKSSKDELTQKDSEIAEITEQLEAAKKDLAEKESELEISNKALEDMKKDQIAEIRMAELKEAKVAIESNLASQKSKVREMDDEEFAAYKIDRVELRDSVKKELEESAKNESETSSNEDTDLDDAGKEVASKEDTVTEPVNIEPGQAIAAAMNFENKPTDDMVNRYEAMGKAMAESLMPKSDR